MPVFCMLFVTLLKDKTRNILTDGEGLVIQPCPALFNLLF